MENKGALYNSQTGCFILILAIIGSFIFDFFVVEKLIVGDSSVFYSDEIHDIEFFYLFYHEEAAKDYQLEPTLFHLFFVLFTGSGIGYLISSLIYIANKKVPVDDEEMSKQIKKSKKIKPINKEKSSKSKIKTET